MSSTASKVADIFTAAGAAFNRLGELTVQLHPLTSDSSAQTSGKWGDTEIEMLRDAVKRFGEDLKKISEIITTKSIAQIKTALKQRVYEQNFGEPANTPRKPPQKRSAKESETTKESETAANGQTEGVAAKKFKQEAADATTSSERTKESNKKITSPSKEAENEVDVESIEDTAAAQNTQNAASDASKTGSEVTSSDLASP